MLKCHYCERPAIGKCGWPELRFVVVDVADLQLGEIIRRWNEPQPRSSKIARVTAIFRMKDGGHMVTFAVYAAGSGGKGLAKMHQQYLTCAKAERLAPCSTPVCEAHARELDDNRHYCSAHWQSWEKVA